MPSSPSPWASPSDPELLILDEPVASLDPLARREFLQDLMEAVAEQELSVVLSSHLVSDLERVCDYLVVLVDSRVQVDRRRRGAAGHPPPADRASPRPGDAARRPAGDHGQPHRPADARSLVRTDAPILDPAWTVSRLVWKTSCWRT